MLTSSDFFLVFTIIDTKADDVKGFKVFVPSFILLRQIFCRRISDKFLEFCPEVIPVKITGIVGCPADGTESPDPVTVILYLLGTTMDGILAGFLDKTYHI